MPWRFDEAKTTADFTAIFDIDHDSMPEGDVLIVKKTDVKITPFSSTDIHRIEAEYRPDEEKKKKALIDTSPVIDIEQLEAGSVEHIHVSKMPTSSVSPSSPSSTLAYTPTPSSRPLLTQAVILQIGHLAEPENVRSTRVEAAVPRMIDRAIKAALGPIQDGMKEQKQLLVEYKFRLDSLAVKVEECQKKEGGFVAVAALNADIAGLSRDVDELKSTDITSLWGNVAAPLLPVLERRL